jgi:hypothetical protein
LRIRKVQGICGIDSENADFAVVDRVANAFKHVETGHPDAPQNQPLTVTSVFERPPGMAGVM